MDNQILFSETQRFRQWWLWILLIGWDVFTLYGVYKQVINGHPFGNKSASNTALLIITGISLFTTILFMAIRLETQIKKDGVYVKFFPLHLKYRHYFWSGLSKCYVRKYSPLGEFGGWGLRYGATGKAYNISGNQGLQLEFANNKKLLIGTKKPIELAEALRKAGQ